MGLNKKERIKKQAIMTSKDILDFYKKERVVEIHGDDYRHFMVKAAIFKILREEGHKVGTEVHFKNGKIADVVDLTTFHVYEVESNASKSDRKEKVDNFRDYERVEDIIVLDPTELPRDIIELREELEQHLLL